MRALSKIEAFYADINLSIHTASHIRKGLSIETLSQALRYVTQRHPLLSSKIIRKYNGLYFQKISQFTIPLQTYEVAQIYATRAHTKYSALIREELNRPLEIENGLIRVVLLQRSATSSTLITTIHHAIADGVCCIALHKEIIQSCIEGCTTTPSLGLMPPLEQLVPPVACKGMDTKPRGDVPANRGTIKCHTTHSIDFVQKKLHKQQLQTLSQQCKTHGVTIHGAICAAHLLAIREILHEDELSCHSPINVRSRLEPPIREEHMFLAVSSYIGRYSLTRETSLWDLGKTIHADIKAFIATGDMFRQIIDFRLPNSPISFSLTNIGTIAPAKGIRSISFMPLYRIPLLGASAGTYNDQLILNYPYLSTCYPRKLIDNIATCAIERLMW